MNQDCFANKTGQKNEVKKINIYQQKKFFYGCAVSEILRTLIEFLAKSV